MKNLRDFTYKELVGELARMGERPFRAAQVYAWVFARGATGIEEMTDLSRELRERLKGEYCLGLASVVDEKTAEDNTKKFVTKLDDGARIESVIIPEGARTTLCVSTQAGCALGCAFCMTGTEGFTRNLTLAELAGQVITGTRLAGPNAPITNVVLMGMGEPLLNYDNVVRFITILTDPKGFALSHNKVTVSTSGITPAIERLGADVNVSLAVSLNATTDAQRSRIMPVNKKYPLSGLLDALKRYPLSGKKHITIEYVLIKGLNDTPADAERLAGLLREINCKINLIVFNEWPGSAFRSPSQERVDGFHRRLMDAGYTVIVRASKGSEISAACGQLSSGRRAPGEKKVVDPARA